MEKPLKITDELLLDYIDGQLSQAETRLVEEACLEPKIADRLEELKKVDQLMSVTTTLNSPSKDFSRKVMSNLDMPIYERVHYSRKNGLILLLLALTTVIIGSLYMTESIITVDVFNSVDLSQLNKIVEVSRVNLPDTISLKMLTNGLLFTVLMLSLLLLDKLVFKPFFKNRSTEVQY